MNHITEELMLRFSAFLRQEEKSENTVEKYLRDVGKFAKFADGKSVTKDLVLAYKKRLLEDGYAVRSVNSMLAALNCFFSWAAWPDCRVRPLRLQQETYCPEERELTQEEYARLVCAARKKNNPRLALLLQTIAATGIRISELRFVTVEAVRTGKISVFLKGKHRMVFLVPKLQKKLLHYAAERGIRSGVIFVSRQGKLLSRSNVWRDMKRLCPVANVSEGKVFPHNLRHLFARVFYQMEKDIVKLADILGHSSINTTRIYTMTTGQEHRRLMERMCMLL